MSDIIHSKEWLIKEELINEINTLKMQNAILKQQLDFYKQNNKEKSQLKIENEEQEKRLLNQSNLLDSVHDVIIALDKNNNISYCNKSFHKLFGWTKDEIVGKSATTLFNYIDTDSKEKAIYVLTGKDTQNIRCGNKYGKRLYIDIKTTKLQGFQSGYGGLLLSIKDVTEQKKLQEALRLSEEKYRELVKFAPVAIYEIDFRNRRVLTANDAMCKLTGYSMEELLNMNLIDILDDKSKIKYQDRVNSWLRGEKPEESVDYKMKGKDGREIYVELKTKFTVDEEGKPFGGNVVSVDVTDRRKMERELEAREKLYHTLFNTIDEGFCVLDLIFNDDGKVIDALYIDANPSYEKLTGLSYVAGKKFSEVFANINGYWFELLEQVVLSGELVHFRNWGKRIGRCFEGYASRIELGESRKIAVIFSDITKRVKVEEELRLSGKQSLELIEELKKADEQKSTFIATLSHELRNPLASINMAISLIERLQPGSEQALKTRQVIIRQTKQLSRLVDDLLDTTRITRKGIELRKSHVELNKLLEHIALDNQPYFDEKGVKLQTNIIPEVLYLEADSSRLIQAIGNLLHNAYKFTPKDGTVMLVLNKEQDKNEAIILVSDTGKGISPDLLPNLFDLFVQSHQSLDRSEGGLGLGLTIVKGIIELHGGCVEISSEGLGKGTQIKVKLPLLDNKIIKISKE